MRGVHLVHTLLLIFLLLVQSNYRRRK
ncbi:unnamed protein product [Ectocarpus sp. CCAP 1310/34]|nr:unnamed protein product [Ectocarpus sp. CCAP 1310/34]